jgi:hypothetical protein
MNMFQVFQNCIQGKDSSKEDIKKISTYIFCKYLASNSRTIQIANFLNVYYKLPSEVQYNFVKRTLNGRIKFIKYLNNQTEKIPKDVEYLMKYYKISSEVAKTYLDEIEPSELNRIRLLYKEH